MYCQQSEDSPNLFKVGGSKLLEWVLTVEELDELRDSIDLVRPRPMVTITRQSNPDIVPAVMWRRKDRNEV